MKLRVYLIRSPAATDNLPEEERVLGDFDNVQLTYNLLRVEGEHTAHFSDQSGLWYLFEDETVWSDVYVEVAPTTEG
jgi:hypothetical protein